MNDDQIRSELERRASSSSSRPDWPKRVLLPAVWHEIDARPQRVMASNWSPRLGVVAVVAALLILVIAVPRLTPQPPAASPTPADDLILTTQQFAAEVSSGVLGGQTVLVRGRLSVSPLFDRAISQCDPPNGLCDLGSLDGTDPEVEVLAGYVPTTGSPGSGEWVGADGRRDYHFPTPPIEGVLALRVLAEAEVEFIGLVHETAAGNELTVADASALDPTTLGPDAAVLVRGYLVDTSRPGEFINIDCAANPYPVISGLPNRYCQITDFLSSLSPNTDFGPNPDRLRVQVGAADRFASNFQGREALYAISPRLYGGCDNGSPPPCWLWDVVARIAPPDMPLPTQSPVVTASPTPSPTPLGLGTTQVECAAPEDLAGEAISISDHSGRIGGCSIAHSDVVPAGNVQVTTTGVPLQLAVDWKVNTACPGDFAMEFWGPVAMPPGNDIYALRIARSGLSGATCIGETVVRRVEVSFTESVKPYEIAAFVADEFQSVNSNSSSVSATTAEGTFTLHLGTPLSGFQVNEPIVIRAQLTYDGLADPAVISGGFPQLWLASLTGGPIFSPYASDLMCPQSQEELSNGGSLGSQFPLPLPPDLSDPNRAFYDQFVSDDVLRLPAGTYLFAASSEFNTGKGCSGEGVRLHTAIAVQVH
jgi:hypothetical protein